MSTDRIKQGFKTNRDFGISWSFTWVPFVESRSMIKGLDISQNRTESAHDWTRNSLDRRTGLAIFVLLGNLTKLYGGMLFRARRVCHGYVGDLASASSWLTRLTTVSLPTRYADWR